MVLERVEAAGRDDPRLPEGAARHLLPAPGLVDQLPRAAEHRAHRRAEPLGEVEPGGVETARVVGRGHAGGHRGVHEAGAVHVRAKAVSARRLQHRLDGLERPHPPAAHVGGLLHRHQPRPRRVAIARRPHRRFELRRAEDAALALERMDHEPGLLGRPAGLGDDRVRGAVQHQLVAPGPGVQSEGDLVAHRPAGEKQARLVTQELGHPLLEPRGGGVGEALLVAHVGGGDRAAHALGGAGLGVAVEVDHLRRVSTRRHRPARSRRDAARPGAAPPGRRPRPGGGCRRRSGRAPAPSCPR